nr:DEAD-like helicase [Mimivirus sp.]URM62533.1 DEAD helicase [Mimivirus sp.]
MKIFDDKQQMLNDANKLEIIPKLFIYFFDSEENYKHTYFIKHKHLFDNIDKFKTNGRYYIHEIALENHKIKPFLYLNKLYPDEKTFKENFESIIKILQKDIIKVFKTEYNELINNDDILLLDASTSTRLNLHVIISPKDRTLYYTNSKYTESAVFHLLTSLININPKYNDYLDQEIYKCNTTIRLIGSYAQTDDDRYSKPIDSNTLKKIKLSNSEKINYLVTYIQKSCRQLNTPLIEQTTKPKNLIKNNIPTTTDFNKKLLQFVRKYHPTAFFNGCHKSVFYNFNYSNRSELCPISGLLHKNTRGFFVYERDTGFYMKCHSDKCQGRKFIGCADITDDFIKSAYQIQQKYLIMNGEIEDKPKEPVKDLIINWLSSNIKTMAIRSAMGTGKTTMIKKYYYMINL